jgi:hypothetical protein
LGYEGTGLAHAIKPTDLSDTWIVEFEGTKMCDLPEKDGGVQVRVESSGQIYTAVEFAEKYLFQLPGDDTGLTPMAKTQLHSNHF